MAVVVIRNQIQDQPITSNSGQRMHILAESGGLDFAVPYAPRDVEYGGWAQGWAQLERSGNTPLLLRKDQPLETVKFTLVIAHPERGRDMSGQLAAVKNLARTKERVLVRYSGMEAGLWRITEATASSLQRHPDTNVVTQATVSLTFTQASDPAPAVGPIARPVPPPPPPAPARRYTVVRGDCLWTIAGRFYGNPFLWPRIFDANRNQIRDPHWIFPSQVFVIP